MIASFLCSSISPGSAPAGGGEQLGTVPRERLLTEEGITNAISHGKVTAHQVQAQTWYSWAP